MAQKETGAKTIINNGFLEKYMASAPTAYTLVYFCAQKFIQEGNEYFTDEQLAQSLGMTEGDIKRAIKFWEDNGEVLRKQRIIAGATGLILFFISITPEIVAEGEPGFGSSAFGAGGMFCAMITGIICCIVFNLFGKFSIFKEDSAIPDFVRQWFDALLPIGLIIFGGFLLVQVFGVDLYQISVSIFMPLQGVLNTWYGFILMNFFTCFIYSMGISSWVLTPVTEPVKLASITANIALAAAGTATAAN